MKKIVSLLIVFAFLLCVIPTATVFAATNLATSGYVELFGEVTAGEQNYLTIEKVKTSATGDLEIPAYYNGIPIKEIKKYAFEDCTKITSIIIPDTVTKIENSAFNGCTGLKSVTFGKGIQTIERYAFYGCKSLESVNITASLKTLGDSAFRGCDALKTVTLPATLQTVEGNIFSIPNQITNFNVANGSYYYSQDGVMFAKDGPTMLYYPCGNTRTSYTIPNGVTKVAYDACRENPYLQTLVMPDTVTTVEDYAFDRCSALTNVTLSKNLQTVGQYAFDRCNLSSLDIPESLKTVGSYAFAYSQSLKKIYWNVPDPSGWNRYALYTNYVGSEFDVVFGENVTAIPSEIFNTSRVKKLTLNNKITEIPYNAFYYIDVEELVIPDSVTKIGQDAFGDANLGVLTIGNGVKEISYGAFDGSSWDSASITEVKYNGTIQEWQQIKIDSSNTVMTNKPRTYLQALVTFDANGGTCDVATKKYQTNEPYGELPVPQRDGYIFQGWYHKNGTKITEQTTVDISGLKTVADITAAQSFQAKWAQKTYQFVTNGGSAVGNISGVVSACPKTTLDGMNFIGWYDNAALEGEPVSFPYNGDALILYAKWQKQLYLNLDTNGGSNGNIVSDGSAFDKVYGSSSGASSNSMVATVPNLPVQRLGHRFLGWSENPNATQPSYQPGDILTLTDSDITLYAVWEGVVYTKTTVLNGICMVTPYGIRNGDTVMLAAYLGNQLVYFDDYVYQGDDIIPFFPNATYDSVRVFVWDSISGCTPLTTPEPVAIP